MPPTLPSFLTRKARNKHPPTPPTTTTTSTRLTSAEITLSRVTEADLPSLAQGMYLAFATMYDIMEPASLRPAQRSEQHARFVKRALPMLRSPDTYWVKATVAGAGAGARGQEEVEVVGFAGWDTPARVARCGFYNLWRRDAKDIFGFVEMMGWSDEEEAELWDGVDVERWQAYFATSGEKGCWNVKGQDEWRREILGGKEHWYLSPLWVHPDYQGRGIASLLLRDVIEKADSTTPSTPMYLEAGQRGKAMYEHFGFVVEKEWIGRFLMVRWGPPGEQEVVREAPDDHKAERIDGGGR